MTDRMRDVDQTHPDTNRPFGLAVFGRGPVADGGQAKPDEQIATVDHEAPVEGAQRAVERGTDE